MVKKQIEINIEEEFVPVQREENINPRQEIEEVKVEVLHDASYLTSSSQVKPFEHSEQRIEENLSPPKDIGI